MAPKRRYNPYPPAPKRAKISKQTHRHPTTNTNKQARLLNTPHSRFITPILLNKLHPRFVKRLARGETDLWFVDMLQEAVENGVVSREDSSYALASPYLVEHHPKTYFYTCAEYMESVGSACEKPPWQQHGAQGSVNGGIVVADEGGEKDGGFGAFCSRSAAAAAAAAAAAVAAAAANYDYDLDQNDDGDDDGEDGTTGRSR
ncbi:hypothetical protein P153DRAFT_431757 [Dothidotthia symphoricarpi CBS 119687]|uniref:Uncharacterized protein n=1 Tax=Dothidotthia symphoricarpi CBS 119687 TaxID=1392245 RepID=A0A6A6AAG0_9PLEO|nr:uncharacterized protein P153DRAFT_431757 [Dothidotthia symphoricarpi CBS 119687]KAF2128912.1 hypothetical protein P153DRAFT_431757 [Dothidotthia symphoricarpi CBS 119687]